MGFKPFALIIIKSTGLNLQNWSFLFLKYAILKSRKRGGGPQKCRKREVLKKNIFLIL